jgi:hypothetical protein
LKTLNTQAGPVTDGSIEEIGTPVCNQDYGPTEAQQDPVMAILQFIPRKRTNTDHVITPKKPLYQTTLEYKEHTLSVKENPNSIIAKTSRPRKSLRKSMIATISDSASEAKTPKAHAQLFSSAEHLPYNENAASDDKKLEAPAEKLVNKRRVSRRSNVATRRSIAHSERNSEIGHNASRSIEIHPRNGTNAEISTPANSTTPGEVVTLLGANELPMTGDTTVVTCPNFTLSEASHDLNQTVSLVIAKSNEQLPNTQGLNRPDVSPNGREGIEKVEAACVEGCISTPMETKHDESAETSGNQNSLSELHGLAICLAVKDQLLAEQDGSRAEGGSVAEKVNSPVHTGFTSSLESGNQMPQAESTISHEPPAELDVHKEIKNIEVTDVPDPNNLAMAYDHDDTDMLRNFLTRVKANKAAKNPPKRKRSLPHSPLRIPLGDLDNNASPSPLQLQKTNEGGVVEPSPSKRKKKPSPLTQCENEPEPRRSSRTKPAVKEPPGAPSFIPVRRLGQDIDTTVTLKRNEEKELAALTRVNTRKNKGNALTALEVLAKKSEEKDDPVMRQRLLKEVFEEKEKGRLDKEKKGREKKNVTWAEELAQFQIMTKGKSGETNDDKENEKVVVVPGGEEKKQGAVRVGVRSKAALGMALNGTPAPKRKMRGRV